MSGGHFYTSPHEVSDAYCGQWEDESGQTPDPTASFAKRLRLAGDAE